MMNTVVKALLIFVVLSFSLKSFSRGADFSSDSKKEAATQLDQGSLKKVDRVTFSFNPTPKGTLVSSIREYKTLLGDTTVRLDKLQGNFHMSEKKSGYTIELDLGVSSYGSELANHFDALKNLLLNYFEAANSRIFLDKEGRAVRVSGVEKWVKYIKKVKADRSETGRFDAKYMANELGYSLVSGSMRMATWNDRIYRFVGKTYELEMEHVRETKLTSVFGEIEAIEIMTVTRSSGCPRKQCVLIETSTRADREFLKKRRVNGLSARAFRKKTRVPGFNESLSYLVKVTKVLMDPTTLDVFRVESTTDADIGDFGKTSVKIHILTDYNYLSEN